MFGRTAIVAAAFLSIGAAAPEPGELHWLGGAWLSASGEEWTEELWTAPRDATLLGVNRSGKGASVTGFEFMRIVCAAGSCTFHAWPRGKGPVPFRQSARSDLPARGVHEIAFERPGNDYPTRIVYRREGDVLLATISGKGGANPYRWTFRRPAKP